MDDVIEISTLDDIEPLSVSNNISGGKFGDGIELLMNDKKDAGTKGGDSLGLDELDQLESELNDFTDNKGDDLCLYKDSAKIVDIF